MHIWCGEIKFMLFKLAVQLHCYAYFGQILANLFLTTWSPTLIQSLYTCATDRPYRSLSYLQQNLRASRNNRGEPPLRQITIMLIIHLRCINANQADTQILFYIPCDDCVSINHSYHYGCLSRRPRRRWINGWRAHHFNNSRNGHTHAWHPLGCASLRYFCSRKPHWDKPQKRLLSPVATTVTPAPAVPAKRSDWLVSIPPSCGVSALTRSLQKQRANTSENWCSVTRSLSAVSPLIVMDEPWPSSS